MKVSAVAYPIQGLIKYHGLRDEKLRFPHHDSISVCYDGLKTITTVEPDESLKRDKIMLNGEEVSGRGRERIKTVINALKEEAGYNGPIHIESENSIKKGKGLGFSASGFAALGYATSQALELDIDHIKLSEIVRLGAGSATRSLAGGFARWYANKCGKSYAEQLAGPDEVDLKMIVIPIPSKIKTEEAHSDVINSPLFISRINYISSKIEAMRKAIHNKDVYTICDLAEEDSLHLHSITMTGGSRMILWEPITLRVIKEVIKLKKEGIPIWYSHDTGPSLFLNITNTYVQKAIKIADGLNVGYYMCNVGGKPRKIGNHLF